MAYRVGRFPCRDTHYECVRSIDAGPFTVTERKFPANYHEPRHDHAVPYLMGVLSGSLTEGEIGYRSGDIGYQPKGPHVSQVHGDGSHVVVLECESLSRQDPLAFRDPLLRFELAQIIRELSVNDPFTCLAIEACATNICALIHDREFAQTQSPEWLGDVAERLADDDRPWSLSSLAQSAGVHPATVTRAFWKRFDCSPATFARSARLTRAKALLAGSDEEIGAIAIRTGFADQSHFGRWFRKKYGMTPAAYRQTKLGKC